MMSGFGTMLEARKHLISRGMSANFADSLAKRYINKLELAVQEKPGFKKDKAAVVCSLMDLFNCKSDNSKALNALNKVEALSNVYLNY